MSTLSHTNVLSHKTQGNLQVEVEAASAFNLKVAYLEDDILYVLKTYYRSR
jgi:hypothetical protein